MKRSLLILSIVVVSLATQVSAQERLSIPVSSEPSGATIFLNGAVVGVTPADVALSTGAGLSELRLVKPGYDVFSHAFQQDETPINIAAELVTRPTIIPVTVTDDRPSAADGVITLREALNYASGANRPVGSDRVLVNGPVGEMRADNIVISVEGYGPSPVLTVTEPLPPLSGNGDRLSGPAKRASIAMAHGYTVRGAGLVIGPETEVENLIIDGFDIGLSAEGFGTMVVRDVSAIGGFVGFSASDGAELLLSGADAINLATNTLAHGDGIIDGFVDAIALDDFDNLTLYSGPSGEEGYSVVEGWVEPSGATNLFVRHAETRPLREVEGLDATTTSYHMYHIFGAGQSDQRWPWHVYDGMDGDYFQWEFIDPPEYEHMQVMGQRPMRTDKFTLHHLQSEARLVKFTFSLLGRTGYVIESFKIDADPLVNEIVIDPELDFFGFRINVVEATGNSPGFTEIEAEILDSDAYEPVSVSRRRAVFPRPARGVLGVVEINNVLRPIGEAIFAEQSPVQFSQFDNAYKAQEIVRETLPQTATVQDILAALAAVSDAEQSEIFIPGTLDIDATLGEITQSNLRLTGGGTIRSTDGSTLNFKRAQGLRLDNLSLSGAGILLEDSYPVIMDRLTVTQFDTAVAANSSYFILTNSTLSDGNRGIQANVASITMTGSVIENVSVGISSRTADPLVLIGNQITTRDHGVDLRAEGGYAGIAHLIANRMEPANPTTPVQRPSYHSRSSLVGENNPSYLGLGSDTFDVRSRPTWIGYGIHDIRVGGAPTQVRLLEFSDFNTRCLLQADETVPGASKPVFLLQTTTVVLHDTGARLLCFNETGGAEIALPANSHADDPIPAAARLVISLDEGFEDAEPGLTSAVTPRFTAEPIGAGQPYPALGADRAAGSQYNLITSLIKAGDHGRAFARAYDAYTDSPLDTRVAGTLIYAADEWATAMESQGLVAESLEFLTDLADSETAPEDAVTLLINAHFRLAGTFTEQQQWEDARHHYRQALVRDPSLEAASQNITYVYQEDLRSRFTPGNAQDTVAWVDAESAEHPEDAAELRSVASILLGNAVVDAINGARFDEGLVLASAHYRWEENERTINNLRVAFQNFAMDAVSRQQSDAVLETLERLTREHGSGPDLAGILTNVFHNTAITAIEAGDFENALSAAHVLYGANPNSDSEDLLAYTYGQQAEAILATGDTVGAMRFLVDALNNYPNLTRLEQQGQSIGNQAALSAYEAGDSQGAVETFETTISIFGTNDNLNQNLRVIYANWAVDSANAGNLDLAMQVARAGQARYPNEQTFADVIDFVNRNQ